MITLIISMQDWTAHKHRITFVVSPIVTHWNNIHKQTWPQKNISMVCTNKGIEPAISPKVDQLGLTLGQQYVQ